MVILQNTAGMYGIYRLVHTMKNTMKVMHIGSKLIHIGNKLIHIGNKLIHIVCVHTECALTTIQIDVLSVNPLLWMV